MKATTTPLADRKSAQRKPRSAPMARDVSILPGRILRKCACGGGCPRCQSIPDSVPVSVPGEPLEREADRVAEQVLREPAERGAMRETGGALISRAPLGPAAPASAAPAGIGEVLRGPQRPLDATERNFFEPRFGRDLGAVRVHTGAEAAESARALDAQAYTYGRDIVFGAGRYGPQTAAGRRLLAHELAHVVQQEDGPAGPARVMRQEGEEGKVTVIVADNLNCPKEKCAGKEDGIRADLTRALGYMARAQAALAGKPSAATERIIDWYFADHSEATLQTLRTQLGCIQKALQETFDNDHYGCGTRWWAHAHTGGSDKLCEDSGAPICLDPSYFDLSARERARTLLHESGHRIGLSPEKPELQEEDFSFRSLSTARSLVTTDSHAFFVTAVALGAPTSWLFPVVGASGGITSLGTGFAKFQFGAEAEHPSLRGISPVFGGSYTRLGAENIGSLFLGARLGDARPGKKGSVYLNLSGELSFIWGDTFAVGYGAEARLGYRIGRFDIGVAGDVLRDRSPDEGARTVVYGGLSFTYLPDL